MTPFYIFTFLVLLTGGEMWTHLPEWLQGLMVLDFCLAAVLLTWQLGQRVRR